MERQEKAELFFECSLRRRILVQYFHTLHILKVLPSLMSYGQNHRFIMP